MVDANIMATLAGPDPFPLLHTLRDEEPVRSIAMPDGARVWLVTRYADARQALADPRLSKRLARGDTSGNYAEGPLAHHMLSSDPPDHTRLRRLVSAAFTARRVERLEPRVTAIAAALLDDLAGREEVDLVDTYAFLLPIQVICELLGVPSDDRDTFRVWSNTMVSGAFSSDAARRTEIQKVMGEMVPYIRQLLADKRARPADDLLSALLGVREEGDQLTEDELVSMVFLMLIAGHETTVNLIGNGVYLLLTHPDQRDRIVADPTLLPAAIEEFLRFQSPVKVSTFRRTTEPVEFSSVTIPAGESVLISMLSANRDESAFTGADQLDVTRRDAAHVAFGHGIHFCLGAALARLEGRIAIAALFERYPRLRLARPAEELPWRPGILIRGLSNLPVCLEG